MARVIAERIIDTIVIDGIGIDVVRSVWSDGGVNYDLYRHGDGTCLSENESLDHIPGHAEICELVALRQHTTSK